MNINFNFLDFKREHTKNRSVTFEDKMKPEINFEDGFTKGHYKKIQSRRKEIDDLILAEMKEYLEDEQWDCPIDEGVCPNSRLLTGNYYYGSETYYGLQEVGCWYKTQAVKNDENSFKIVGMESDYDANKVETAVLKLKGVHKASADYTTRRLTVDYDKTIVRFSDIEKAIYYANVTREYSIHIYVRLTENDGGVERDYFGMEFELTFSSFDAEFEIGIVATDSIG